MTGRKSSFADGFTYNLGSKKAQIWGTGGGWIESPDSLPLLIKEETNLVSIYEHVVSANHIEVKTSDNIWVFLKDVGS